MDTGPNSSDIHDQSGGGSLMVVRNTLCFIGSWARQLAVHELGGSNDQASFKFGGPVDPSYRGVPEQIARKRGVLSVMVPNGDTPFVYDFGNGCRRYAH